MAYDPSAANYGRAQYGQVSPFRDLRRKGVSQEEEEQLQPQQQPQYAPPPRMPQSVPSSQSPLAQAVAPQKISPRVGGYQQPEPESPLSQAIGGGASDSRYRFSTAPSADGSLDSLAASKPQVTPQYATQDTIGAQQPKTQPLPEQPAPAPSPLSQAVGGPGYTLSNIGGSGGGGNAYTGFDFGQSAGNRDTGKSMKYAFADATRMAGESGIGMPRTKEEAEAYFNANVLPALEAQGYKVNWVKGDKAEVSGWQGTGVVDFLKNADGANPEFQWLVEGGGGAAGADPLASAIGGSAADPVAMQLAQQLGIDTSNPLWAQILQQLIDEQGLGSQQQPPSQQFSGSASGF